MKALKVIGILLVVVVALGLIASLILPKTMEVTETTAINAPIEVVWDNINNWEKRDTWSPWYKEDPDMKITFEGENGAVGSKFSWTGNKNVGSGSQVFTSIDAESQTTTSEVTFKEPWEGKGDIAMKLEDAGDGVTNVSWSYSAEQGIPGNLFTALFDAKGMITKSYQMGLTLLKEIAEKQHSEAPAIVSYDITTVQREAGKYAVKREVVKMENMEEYFMNNMPAVGKAFEDAEMAMSAPCAFFFTWDEEKNESEMSVSMAIVGDAAPEGYEIYNFVGGECLNIDHYGDYGKTEGAHMAIAAYMAENGYELNGPVMEEYITDPGEEPDPTKWLSKIVYPVKKSEAPEES